MLKKFDIFVTTLPCDMQKSFFVDDLKPACFWMSDKQGYWNC